MMFASPDVASQWTMSSFSSAPIRRGASHEPHVPQTSSSLDAMGTWRRVGPWLPCASRDTRPAIGACTNVRSQRGAILYSASSPACSCDTPHVIGQCTSMTFTRRPSTYQISLAPTSRARCRACKRRIERGELRIAINAFVRPGRYTQLVRCCRIECLDARFGAAVLAVYGSPARVPVEAGVDIAEAAAVRARLDHMAGQYEAE